MPVPHGFIQPAVTDGTNALGEELPAHAPDQPARPHAEKLFGFGVEVREAPVAIDCYERIADALEYLGGVERAGDLRRSTQGRLGHAAQPFKGGKRALRAGRSVLGQSLTVNQLEPKA